jgi:hypothetical protein
MGVENKMQEALQALATRVGTSIGGVLVAIGNIALLPEGKRQLVPAILDLYTKLTQQGVDLTSYVNAQSQAVKDELRGGASAAMDSFKELEDYLAQNATTAQAMLASLAGCLHFDKANTLTDEQRLSVCRDLGIGDPSTNYVAVFESAMAAAIAAG